MDARVCASSSSKAWPAVLLTNTACETVTRPRLPTREACGAPPSSRTTSATMRVHGSVAPNSMQPRVSSTHALILSITGGGMSSYRSPAAYAASTAVAPGASAPTAVLPFIFISFMTEPVSQRRDTRLLDDGPPFFLLILEEAHECLRRLRRRQCAVVGKQFGDLR